MAPLAYLFLSICVFRLTVTLPTGAPSVACGNMKPLHPAPMNKPDQSVYFFNISEGYFKQGSIVSGVLSAPEGKNFKGFLIQARNESDGEPLGDFVRVNSSYSQTVCGDKSTSGLTHVINNNKTSVAFSWRAPDESLGNVTFRASVVQSYTPSHYWMDILSETVMDCSVHPDVEACAELTTEVPPLSTQSTQSSVQTTPMPADIPFDKACGKTKGCFPPCEDTGCDFLITWQNTGTTVTFEMAKQVEDENTWVGIGFSTDGKMDKTDVVACFPNSGKMAVEASHNVGHSNQVYPKVHMSLSAMSGSYKDGVLRCQFSRDKDNENEYFKDLDTDYYLLIAHGGVASGIKEPHTSPPVQSSEKVDFLKNYIVGEDDTDTFDLVKLHAVLMVVAWIFFSSVGQITARYCKDMMPGTLIADIKMWFHIHRIFMTLTLLCVLTAFVVIFVHVGGFSQIVTNPDLTYTQYHPYLGLAVTVLTITNPIMALFRPSPTHKNRPMFNWAHFLVGSGAHGLALITITFGLKLEAADINPSSIYVMIVYLGIFALVHIIMTSNRACRNKDVDDTIVTYTRFATDTEETPGGKHGISMAPASASPDYGALGLQDSVKRQEAQKSGFSTMVLVFHIILMTVTCAFLVFIICRPNLMKKWLKN